MLVHRRVTPQQYVAGTHLYTWVKRDKVELSSLSKEKTRRARLEPRTSRSRVRGVNRSATHASNTVAMATYLCSLELALTYEIFFQHSKRNFVSLCGQVVSSIYELSL